MFVLDPETASITLPQGDTAMFKVKITGGRLPAGSALVFGVATAGNNPKFVKYKVFDIDEDTAIVRLTNKDTRDLTPGNYVWDVRVVTDPDRNDAGEVRAWDNSDDVYSAFSGTRNALPPFTVTPISAEV